MDSFVSALLAFAALLSGSCQLACLQACLPACSALSLRVCPLNNLPICSPALPPNGTNLVVNRADFEEVFKFIELISHVRFQTRDGFQRKGLFRASTLSRRRPGGTLELCTVLFAVVYVAFSWPYSTLQARRQAGRPAARQLFLMSNVERPATNRQQQQTLPL